MQTTSPQPDLFSRPTIKIDGRSFIQQYTLCKKPTCWCMKTGKHAKTGAPGHGPYWYELRSRHGKITPHYIGKELLSDALARH